MTESNKNEYPVIRTVLNHLKLNIYIFVLYSILSFIIVFFVFKKQYTSKISILPSAASFTSSLASKIGNIGDIAGLDLGTSSAQSQEMYMGIVNSRRLLEKVIHREYTIEDGDKTLTGDMIYFLDIDGDTQREIFEKALKEMREEVIYVEIDEENDILYLEITTPYPDLSAKVGNFLTGVLNEIVQNEVQKEYRQQLTYINQKIVEVKDSLKTVESNLKTFLALNVDPTIPEFQVEQIKLKRHLDVLTQIYIELRKQLEIFTLENMVNLSDIKILDDAIPAYKKSRPKRALLLISLVIIGVFLHIIVITSMLILQNLTRQLKST